jgi:hypothetical protein
MLRVSIFGNKGKDTNPVRHYGIAQSPFIRFIDSLDAKHRVSTRQNDGYKYTGNPQSSSIRFIDSLDAKHRVSTRQNDGYKYTGNPQSSFIRFIDSLDAKHRVSTRQNDGYRYTEEMSRKGLNMYNPLQAKRSWGYKITTTLLELRSSSICYHINQINHSSDKRGRKSEGTKGRKVQATSISSWLARLLLAACCLLPYNANFKSNL